jgi:hyperosmotically inducible protein
MTKILLCMFGLMFGSAYASTASTSEAAKATETTINQQGVTADTQRKSDDTKTEVARRLRAKIMADDQLSTQAHNVKIIATDDAITLKGPVANRSEKVRLENYARSLAGELKVFNQLVYKR